MLLAIKRTALRAEMVLMLLEREIRPMATQLQSLTEELRTFSRQAGRDMERMAVAAQAVGQLSQRVGLLVGLAGTLGRVGQVVGAASGVKKGLDVFITKLLSRNRGH
jgi:hypothetical protein